MADHIEDDEQVEALKRWWAENGRSTVVAVVLAVTGTVGWQQYQGWSADQTADAADTWSVASAKLASGDPVQQAEGETLALALIDNHGGSTYALFASLQLAKQAVADENMAAAEAHLRTALASAEPGSEWLQLIQVRLARVLAANGDTEQALTMLAASDGSMPAAVATARGDIHLAAGREQEALDAYLEARAATLEMGNPPGLLDAKITSLQSRLDAAEQAS